MRPRQVSARPGVLALSVCALLVAGMVVHLGLCPSAHLHGVGLQEVPWCCAEVRRAVPSGVAGARQKRRARLFAADCVACWRFAFVTGDEDFDINVVSRLKDAEIAADAEGAADYNGARSHGKGAAMSVECIVHVDTAHARVVFCR